MAPAGGKNGSSDMDLDPTFLMLSLIPGGIGFVLFMYGRKADRWPQLVTGLAFTLYPYFTGGTTRWQVSVCSSAACCVS